MPSLRPLVLFALVFSLVGSPASSAEVETPPADKEPVLRIDPGGPAAFVASLAFSPDGKTLYAGGWDKVVRGWELNNKGVFEPSRSTYRVPVGPGVNGALNAIALSSDGLWLAAAGNGMARQIAGFRDLGFMVPTSGARSPVMLRDVGTIYVFNTRDRTARTLRGHRGYVTALTFGPARGQAPPLLLSAAVEEKGEDTVETQLTARLWDVDKGESVAVLPGLPRKALGNLFPGLTLWRGGDRVQAALALFDGHLRLWEPAAKEQSLQKIKDLDANLSVAHLGGGRLLTAGYDGKSKKWRLARWRVPAEGEPRREEIADLGDEIVRALLPLSRQGDGVADLAAIVGVKVGRPEDPYEYRLRIVDLAEGKFGDLVADHLLWKDHAARQPAAAASLRGEYLAVASAPGHAIHVYPLRSLLGEKAPSPRILGGDVLTFQHASFVRGGKNLGLLLNRDVRKKVGEAAPQPDEKQGDWVFDFANRSLSDKLKGWQADRPEMGGWRAKIDGATAIAVYEGENRVRRVRLQDKRILTDYALLPPGGAVKVPLLAVASHENGQPHLAIYNAKSGEQLREFTGHKERLRSLAFSADGRLLVSAAEDGTVRVWSLTDLDTVLERRGELAGVAVGDITVGESKGGVKVREVKPDSLAVGKLKPGDVLVGVVENKKFRQIDSPAAFYEAMYLKKPGSEVVLRRGDPNGRDDIPLVVEQGVDERKCLLALFVTRADKAADCEWIGWSPLGPYDVSSAKAEKYLGWHFNTGDPKAPARFAEAGEYRKFFYRKDEGFLGQLIERGSLGQVEAPRLPAPVLGLSVEENGPLWPGRAGASVVVRRPAVRIRVALFERPLSSLSSLSWRLDGGAETPFELDQRVEASFRVPVTLTRGEHRFEVFARTHDRSAEPTRASLLVSYRPPPPKVAHADSGGLIRVSEAKFVLKADIAPSLTGEALRVAIRHREGEEKSYTRTFAGREVVEGSVLHVEQELKLKSGNNEVEVVAVNVDAPDGEREAETGRLKLTVFYHFKAKPPMIAFRNVVPVPRRGEGEPLAADPSRPIVVHLREVKLVGVIKSDEEPLTRAEWDRGPSSEAVRLDGFKPDQRAEFAFEQCISLAKGTQALRVRARTKHSEDVEYGLTVVYQPPVPLVTSLTEPSDGVVFDGEDDTKPVAVRGPMVVPEGAADYQAVILVNGRPAPERPVLDEKAGTLSGTALLGPGENRIEVRLSNPWRASSSSDVVFVHYVRPPKLVGELKRESVLGSPRVNLEAEFFSPIPLKRDSVRVEVNGVESVLRDVRIEPGPIQRHWTVRLGSVRLDACSPEQQMVLRLSNAEAACRAPARLTMPSEKVLPAPQVEFLEPRREATVSTSRVTVRFQVHSDSKLLRVHLLRDGRPLPPIDLAGMSQEGEKFELTVTTEVELEPATNRLSVEAVSVSGRMPDSPQLVISYVPPPLRVVIEKLTESRANGVPVKERGRERGIVLFPEVASGRVWLHGHVAWTDKGEGSRHDYFLLRVFVNGFQQLPFVVERKPREMETPFRVPMLLNRPKGNRVSVSAMRQDAGGPVECSMDCRRPITGQRMHILALTPRSPSEEVKEQILKALNARQAEAGSRGAAFTLGDVQTLSGSHVKPEFLCTVLAQFKDSIQARQAAAGPRDEPRNDVLMIYYEGGERIDERGHFFETYAPSDAKAFGMPCDKMVSFLSDVPGAHVLLLDVERPATAGPDDRPRDHIERWKDDYPDVRTHVVVMRCARRGEPGRRGEVRLIPVLRKKLPQAGRLSKLMELVEQAIESAPDHNLLVFTKYLPTELADLVVGTSP